MRFAHCLAGSILACGAIPATTQWQEGVRFKRFALINQLQQEGIAYGLDGRSIF